MAGRIKRGRVMLDRGDVQRVGRHVFERAARKREELRRVRYREWRRYMNPYPRRKQNEHRGESLGGRVR